MNACSRCKNIDIIAEMDYNKNKGNPKKCYLTNFKAYKPKNKLMNFQESGFLEVTIIDFERIV